MAGSTELAQSRFLCGLHACQLAKTTAHDESLKTGELNLIAMRGCEKEICVMVNKVAHKSAVRSRLFFQPICGEQVTT